LRCLDGCDDGFASRTAQIVVLLHIEWWSHFDCESGRVFQQKDCDEIRSSLVTSVNSHK
jgi:hypothetical protein